MLRVGIFVNVANQFGALIQRKKGHKINYEKYLKYFLNDGENLLMAYAYGSKISDEAESFIHALKRMGYLTKFVTSIKIGSQDILHPNRNVEMAVDIMGSYKKLDIIIIGSNDIELVPLINYLQCQGIKVIIATPVLLHNEGNVNIDLLTMTDLIENIQSMREKK